MDMVSRQNDIKGDPVVIRLLEKMPKRVADSFNEEQLSHLKSAIGAREWGTHKIDVRGTVKLLKWRFYYVILIGQNRRVLSDDDLKLARFLNSILAISFIAISILSGLLIAYLVKSSLGIDLFEGWSLGIWNWVKSTFR